MFGGVLAAVVVACGPSSRKENQNGAPPAINIAPKLQTEPRVRVWLRSLQAKHTAWTLAGKGGLTLQDDHGAFAPTRAVSVTAEAKLIRVTGRALSRTLRITTAGGVFYLNKHGFAGTLAWQNGRWIHGAALENYCLGVLRGELPLPGIPVGAAAAQAMAVRSYTMHYLAKKRAEYDVDDTTLFQRYVGLRYAPQDDHLRAGVQQTRGLYLAHKGKPLKCYYHSTCGGHTADVPTGLDRAAQAPMGGVACEHCVASKYYRWSSKLPRDAVLRAAGLTRPLQTVRIAKRGPGGRAQAFLVRANGKQKTIHANTLRLALGGSVLRSTNITTLDLTPDGVAVAGGGWGHGVGLCQMGAIGLGQKGWTGPRIAAYYYPGAKITRAY